MSRLTKPHHGIEKPAHQRRGRQPKWVRHTSNAEIEASESWIASPLLSAIDDMDRHVQEMLDYDQRPAQPLIAGAAHSEDIKAYIFQEVKHRVEKKLGDIVKTTITARMRRLEASQRTDHSMIDALQTTSKRDGQTIQKLDALHRHEHTLNTALVDRLFNALSVEGHPDTRFGETTFDLQGTDSVNSVLVSHVEALVMKVQNLEREVKWLRSALKEQGSH